jgi:DNA-binding LacI/PurR family transcriptional regulator
MELPKGVLRCGREGNWRYWSGELTSTMPDLPLVPTRISLAEQTARLLRDALHEGRWVDRMPGERELSRQMNVSRPTLRMALEQLEREGLLKKSPGKHRLIARRPRGRKPTASRTIGLLTPLPLQEVAPFALCWMDKLRVLLAAAGYPLEIYNGQRWYARRPEKDLAELIRRESAAAWVLFVANETMQGWFAKSGLPCVLSGTCHAGIDLPFVDVDYRAVCRHAAGQFLARGHRRIGLLLNAPGMAGDRESEIGFFEAFHREGSEGATPLVASHDGTPASIRKCLDGWLRLAAPPTAFLVARSLPALTVASDLSRRGLRLPRDVALIARDSDHFLEYHSPSLACYHHDPDLHARRIARVVIQLARGGVIRTRAIRMMPTFLQGGSL